MKTISPKVKDLLDQISLLDVVELKEFRILLGETLGLQHLNTDKDEPEGDTPAGIPRSPKTPVLSGDARKVIDSL